MEGIRGVVRFVPLMRMEIARKLEMQLAVQKEMKYEAVVMFIHDCVDAVFISQGAWPAADEAARLTQSSGAAIGARQLTKIDTGKRLACKRAISDEFPPLVKAVTSELPQRPRPSVRLTC
ncbi:hypothetical protein NDU88_001265 [Pleurodeles waltl]|uniref:Uncharacterized protein n=1 Tax=Pleurodeles waltl TaxID=8319 RepID=A0AAV7S9A9_PLEWA|nr:hypothetical protein NDU88_001265 [Pleurodeles waltl]